MAFHRVSVAAIASRGFWGLAIVAAAAGVVVASSRADAASYYYWQDVDPGYYRPDYRLQPLVQPRRPATRQSGKKQPVEKDGLAKPQAPLIISVSINKQQVKVYDANGLFAQAPVSTGMRGHPTPMGVFSIIQKHKWHQSNIYSGAPMPYMQRITWSGVAMHAGVLPGYPASHGCIRMPNGFAIKMWNWTRLGARVLVTPGEIAPENFSHPLLPSLKIQPQPAAAAQVDDAAPVGEKADKGTADKKLETAEDKLKLRASAGNDDALSPVMDSASLRERTHTADASASAKVSAANEVAMLSNATSAKSSITVDVVAAEPVHDPESKTAEAQPKREDSSAGAATSEVKTGDKPAPADAAPDASKDQTRLPDAAKAAAAKAEAAKHAGQISVLISGKDSKLYVRQNFAPLFEAPVTIAPSDRSLGTHVYTVELDKKDPNVLHWSVISLPPSGRTVLREDDPRRLVSRKAAHTAHLEARPLADNPSEALDRISVPADVMARITEALTTGGSIIVSDQGLNQGETGEGTDFIVSMR